MNLDLFYQKKQERKAYLENNVYRWKQEPCNCCNGTGHYDSNGSPKCTSCFGTGKQLYKLIDGVKKTRSFEWNDVKHLYK